MQVFFIEQALKNTVITSVFKSVEQKEDRIILNLDCKKIKLKKKIKLIRKIKKFLQNNHVDEVIIEKRLKEDKQFIDLLDSNNISIVRRKILI